MCGVCEGREVSVLTVEVDNKRSSFLRESTAQQWVADNTVLNEMCND